MEEARLLITLLQPIHESPLSKQIQESQFPKKFSTLTFDYDFGVSDLVQHIRHFQNKMVIYSGNDPVMCPPFTPVGRCGLGLV